MGLGPPVCEKCRVVGSYEALMMLWYCPICNNKDMQWSAWDCGLTEEELADNLRFLKFVKGEDDASVIR